MSQTYEDTDMFFFNELRVSRSIHMDILESELSLLQLTISIIKIVAFEE